MVELLRRRAGVVIVALAAVVLLVAAILWARLGQHVVLSATCDGAPAPTATCVMYPPDPTDAIVLFERTGGAHRFETMIRGPGTSDVERVAYCMDDTKQAAVRLRSPARSVAATVDVCTPSRSTSDAARWTPLTADELAALQAARRRR